MTDGRPPTHEDLAALVAEMDRDAPAAGPGLWDLGQEEALWLALPPAWTVDVAEQARFPAPPVGAFVERAAQASVVEFNESIAEDGSETKTFWPRDSVRESLLTGCLDHFGLETVQHTAATIAERILDAESDGHDVGDTVHDWAQLVLAGNGHVAGDTLLDRVRDAVIADDLARAMRALSTAEALGPLAPHLASAVVRARRLVHLGYRRRHDTVALGGFLRREEQVTAVRELIRGSGRAWALHLIGMGGVGKTMLIRYLSSGAFARDEHVPEFPVARVDFDHLSPAYPMRRPVQLLVELADELAPYADDTIRGAMLDAFLEMAVSAHASAAGRPPTGDPDADPIVRLATSLFGRFLAALPQPVVLVLDTCEELAKMHPGNAEAPALARTFALLEEVHAAAPGVRVLLAGRRHLASSGAGWRLAEPGPLPPRDYLRRAELRGFTREEALDYLGAGVMPAELAEAILARSPEAGRTAGIAAADRPNDRHSDRPGDRYNPFDLALYRSWWQSDRALTGERLRTAGEDAYVEARIAGRLQDPALERLLPAVALLGRFDETLLAPVAADAGTTAVTAIARLAEQEWVETATHPDTGDRVLQVAELLLPRLLRWAGRSERRARLDAARTRLAQRLTEHLAEKDLDRIGADHVITALRLVAPEEAARLWSGAEERIAAEGRWDWAVNVLPRVRGEFAEDAGRPLLAAGLAATAIAVRRRENPFDDLEAAWQAVAETVAAAHLPVPPAGDDWAPGSAAMLLRRAILGAAAVRRQPSFPNPLTDVVALLREPDIDPALNPSIAAALETLAEQNDPAVLTELRETATRWFGAHDLSPDAAAAAGVALATMTASHAREAESYLVTAEVQIRSGDGGPPAADLPGRPDPLTWIRLHRARLGSRYAEMTDPRKREQWLFLGRTRLATVDGERLVSQCLQLELSVGTVPVERLNAIAALHSYSAQRRPDRLIHDAVPPLFVTLAEGYLAAGRPDRAQQVLEKDRKASRSARGEDATERLANLALARLARRMRTPMSASLANQLNRYTGTGVGAIGDPRVCGRLWGARLLLEDVAPAFDSRAEWQTAMWLAWWSSQRIDPTTGRVHLPAASWPRNRSKPVDDLAAAVRQAVRIGTGPGLDDLRYWLSLQPGEPASADFRFTDPEPVGSALFRTALLTAPPVSVASAALEAGELCALRRPEEALDLLDLAARLARGRSPVLAFQAEVCATLVSGHLHDGGGRRDLAGYYEEFREHTGADLPSWEDLPEATGYQGVWRDWLIRCRVAAAFAAGETLPEPPKGPRSPEVDPARFRAVFSQQIEDRPPPPAYAPAPLDDEPAPLDYGFSTLGHPSAPVRRSRLVRTSGVLGLLVLIVATLTGLFLWFFADDPHSGAVQPTPTVGSTPGSDLPGPRPTTTSLPEPPRAGGGNGTSGSRTVIAVALGAVAVAFWGIPRIPVVRRRLIWAFGMTEAVAGGHASLVALTVAPVASLRPARAATRWLLLPSADRWSIEIGGPPSAEQAASHVFSQRGSGSGPRYGTLVTPPDVATLDWEATIAAATGRTDSWRLTWHRTASGTPRDASHIWTHGGVDIMAAPGCATQVRNGYGEHLPAPELLATTGIEAVDGGPLHRVRHRVGTPVLTSNGVLLRLDGRVRLEKAPTDWLLAPDEIDAATCPLIVLQDLPYDAPPHVDDLHLSLLRQFAVDVAATGATILVVLPALPFDLVTPVTRQLARRLADRSGLPGRRAVAGAIDAVKTEIVRYGVQRGEAAAAREIALHVLHFVA
ncbi:AAA family ATPase [Actinoplanes sp. GCM10030250]|uniref:AAA family ATPase n=1 Tax=Actinoplanes sp. GCM10030250 TaxID=3273376 RepID=UPI003622A26F